jgi:hypothetical protein
LTFIELFYAIKSYLAGFLTFLVFFSAAGVFLWDEKKEIEVKSENIHKQLLYLKDEEIKLERKKSQDQLEFKEKEYELEKKEEELEAQLTELKRSILNAKDEGNKSISNKESKLDFLIEKYESKIQDVKELYTLYSQEARKSKAEETVLTTMKEFSDLSVSLDKPDWCNKEYMARYYKGEILLDKISAINSKYSISDEYSWFVKKQSAGFIMFNNQDCEANKNLNADAKSRAG